MSRQTCSHATLSVETQSIAAPGRVALSHVLCAVGCWLFVPSARAAPPPDAQACLSAHLESQVLLQRGQWGAALARLDVCAAEGCPPMAARDCASWRAQVERLSPAIVLQPTGARGQRLEDVEVYAGGERLRAEADGRTFRLDPGEHTLRVVARGHAAQTRAVHLREGETQPLDVQLAELPAPPSGQPTAPEPPRRGVAHASPKAELEPPNASALAESPGMPPVLYWSLAGLTIAGTATFVYFAIEGRLLEDRLEQCAPACEPEQAQRWHDDATRNYTIANVSLVVAIGSALGLASLFLFDRRGSLALTGSSDGAQLRWNAKF